ncbi:hypothetical protein SAMN02910369_00786 [Lachnospiraceae bacterium NE2001]|nr:hypothetical protein SAMN02910369_00786 [Lachnospiraceae bacterium NE2001]
MIKIPENLIDVECPDCGTMHRIDIDKQPGHCQICGRLLRYNKVTMEIEPGAGEEADIILTQYEQQRRRQQFGSPKDDKRFNSRR